MLWEQRKVVKTTRTMAKGPDSKRPPPDSPDLPSARPKSRPPTSRLGRLARLGALAPHALPIAIEGAKRAFGARRSEDDSVRVREKMLGSDDRFQIGVSTTLKFAIADDMEAAVQRKMAEAALREPLTGLYNRRHFQERFAAEVAVAHRHGRPLSLLMIDVDHFKRVNDKHGHLAGDEVLKTVARALQQGIRIEDILARFGGEEFVVLAREAEQAEAVAVAERLRQLVEVAQTRWESGHDVPVGIAVTVSIGVAQLGGEETERDLFD